MAGANSAHRPDARSCGVLESNCSIAVSVVNEPTIGIDALNDYRAFVEVRRGGATRQSGVQMLTRRGSVVESVCISLFSR